MQLPIFTPFEDPGPSFDGLLRALGETPKPLWPGGAAGHAMPAAGVGAAGATAGAAGGLSQEFPHGTTVLALRSQDGVVLAGDRQATMGYQIGSRTIKKVFQAGSHAGVAIAGAAGQAVELVKFFQLSIAHYEKLEGISLSLDGQANMLAQLVRGNFAQAIQTGLLVMPIFAGYDQSRQRGRIFEYDITGGRYEEHEFVIAGSGSVHARTAVKLSHKPADSIDTGIKHALAALFWAADEDVATGGPDVLRGIYPTLATITADGYRELPSEEVGGLFEEFLADQDAIRQIVDASEPEPEAAS